MGHDTSSPTRDAECVAFLQWALPRLGMRWPGFGKVRRQVCRRLRQRLRELGLPDLDAYRGLLLAEDGEWAAVDTACRVTISRFYRDRGVFEALGGTVLPQLAREALGRGAETLRVWSAGCASGEEPYSVGLAWTFAVAPRFPGLTLSVLATDAGVHLLERARRGVYAESSLREIPAEWRERAFEEVAGGLRLRESFRAGIDFQSADLRRTMPDGAFDAVLCRNLAFTYFDAAGQRAVLDGLLERLVAGGAFVVGGHEAPPDDLRLVAWPGAASVFRCHDPLAEPWARR